MLCDSVSVRIKSLVTGAIVLAGSQVENEGLYRIGLRLPLLGGFADAMLPEVAPINPSAYDLTLPGLRLHRPTHSPPQILSSLCRSQRKSSSCRKEPYTGVLVDARELSAYNQACHRASSAKTGRVICSAATVDRSYAAQYGIVGYAKDIDRALSNERLGGEANPSWSRPWRRFWPLRRRCVWRLRRDPRADVADSDDDFLRECRVVFILGPRPLSFEELYGDTTFTDTTLMSEAEET